MTQDDVIHVICCLGCLFTSLPLSFGLTLPSRLVSPPVVGSFHSPPTSSGAGGGLRREENDRRDEPNDVGR